MTTFATTPPYEPPALRVLGSVHELTQSKQLTLLGDAILFGGPTGGILSVVNGS